MSFRSSEYCKRYEYVSFDLQTPIIHPPNDQHQKKSGYKFYVDTTSESNPLDLYNSYVEVSFKLTKMDNTGYAANDQAAIINGGHSIISQLKCEYNGTPVIDTPAINHALNVKNLVEFSREYSDRVGPSMFHYVDTQPGAIIQKYNTVNHALTGNAQNIATTPAENAQYNAGFAKRHALLTAAAENNIVIPLNRYGFFQSFLDEIAPNGKLTIDLALESDDNVVFRSGGDPGRYIITKMVLWIPKMVFNVAGEDSFLTNYMFNHTWRYLTERVEVSPSLQTRQGTFKITSAISKPRHLFIWFLNAAKLNDQEQNMFVFNTYNITNARTVVDCQVELNNGMFFPQVRLDPTGEEGRAYRRLIEYEKGFNSFFSAPTIDLKSFKELFGILYFDLTTQDDSLKDENSKIELRFTLNDAPNADYYIYALILHESTLSVDVTSGKAILRA